MPRGKQKLTRHTLAVTRTLAGPRSGVGKRNLLGHTEEQLNAELAAWSDRPFRARQVFEALHRQRLTAFEDISVLSAPARRSLADLYTIERPPVGSSVIARDGTAKLLFRMPDGASFEAVDIPDHDRRTLCISSQAGCALGCTFCVTGAYGAGRNLSAAEIVGQVYTLCDQFNVPAERARLVLMGMGEPLLNLDSVREALEILSTSIPWRRITVSTAGIVPGIRALSEWPQRPNLAVSLHAPDDTRRARLMPINRKYPLDDLLAALRDYPATKHRPLFIEYTLIAGVNDSVADARAVALWLQGLPAKVNLIPMNPDPALDPAFRPPSPQTVQEFRSALVRHGFAASVRRRRGDDVAAACGQLRGSQFGGVPLDPVPKSLTGGSDAR